MKRVWIPTSLADLVDRVSILTVKREKLTGDELTAVTGEFHELGRILALCESHDTAAALECLVEINRTLWRLEDDVRRHRRLADYVSLSRWNDRRYQVKRRLNERAGQEFLASGSGNASSRLGDGD